ncbi:MAG: 3-deoxy-manno-octulosonate cytidylyltransferase [Oligoflexus sp.]
MKANFSWQDWLIVIPARLQSTRLPEKPLADLGGKTLIVRVFERLRPLLKDGAKIVVGTDSEKILKVCQDNGIDVLLTNPQHPSGTDRVYEVAAKEQRKYILNVQGDEPFINIADLKKLCLKLCQEKNPEMATLIYRNLEEKDFHNPNCVKVVRQGGYAMYFSRASIPFPRDGVFSGFWQHLGVYAFSFPTLKKFCGLPTSELEQIEKLEQLRALENGIRIVISEADQASLGIDTPEDLEEARARY